MVTVWTDFQKSEETGRIGNFARAAYQYAGMADVGAFSGQRQFQPGFSGGVLRWRFTLKED